jgi:pantoate--beta-alanine ligase
LDAYPRQFEKDSQLLDELGVDHVFAPATMYGPNHATYVDLPCWDDLAEGVSRPGHFRGVATIVTKLLNVVQPTNAYFGQKDAAQCVLVQRIVEDLDLVTKIHVCATVRATDGLALSSRNAYLTADERRAAPIVYRSLCAAKQLLLDAQVSNNQSVTAVQLQTAVRQILETEPLVSEIQYISVDSKLTMRPLETVTKEDGAIISLACKVGSVRLIDNVIL